MARTPVFCDTRTQPVHRFVLHHDPRYTYYQARIVNLHVPDRRLFDAASPEYRSYCVRTYKENISLFSARNLPVSIEAFSDDFFKMWDDNATTTDVFGNKVQLGGPISFAYIDGAHTYEAAKMDFENVAKNLLPGGFVLFDDSNPQLSFGCVQSALEASKTPGYTRLFSHVNGLNVFLRKSNS